MVMLQVLADLWVMFNNFPVAWLTRDCICQQPVCLHHPMILLICKTEAVKALKAVDTFFLKKMSIEFHVLWAKDIFVN